MTCLKTCKNHRNLRILMKYRFPSSYSQIIDTLLHALITYTALELRYKFIQRFSSENGHDNKCTSDVSKNIQNKDNQRILVKYQFLSSSRTTTSVWVYMLLICRAQELSSRNFKRFPTQNAYDNNEKLVSSDVSRYNQKYNIHEFS